MKPCSRNADSPKVEIVLTQTAKDALKQLGAKPRSFQRMAKNAFHRGVRHKDTNGSLGRYFDKLWLERETANSTRIHGEKVWLFRYEKGKAVLVSVRKVPKELKNQANGTQRKVKKARLATTPI